MAAKNPIKKAPRSFIVSSAEVTLLSDRRLFAQHINLKSAGIRGESGHNRERHKPEQELTWWKLRKTCLSSLPPIRKVLDEWNNTVRTPRKSVAILSTARG